MKATLFRKGWDSTGLFVLSFNWRYLNLHFFPRRCDVDDDWKGWLWGSYRVWLDGPLDHFGLGPLLLVCWSDVDAPE